MLFKEIDNYMLTDSFYSNSIINEAFVCYATLLRLNKADLFLYYHQDDKAFILFDGVKSYLISFFEVIIIHLIDEYNVGNGTSFSFQEVKQNIKKSYDSNISMDLLFDVINLLNYFYSLYLQVKEIEYLYEKSDKDFETFLSTYSDSIYIDTNYNSLGFNYVDNHKWNTELLKYILATHIFRNIFFKINWQLIPWKQNT